MTIKEKIQKYIDFKGISVYRLEADAGLSKGYWGKTKSISAEVAMKISRVYSDMSTEWLLRDNGEMIRSEIETQKINESNIGKDAPYYEELNAKAIPHIDIVAAECGLPNGFNGAIMKEQCEHYIIPDLKGCDFTIQAKGRSMINRTVPERSINNKDFVGCKIVKGDLPIRWGEVYALATSEGVVIKKIRKSKVEGYVSCISYNIEDGYDPYDIPVNEIYDWALVIGVVRVESWL